MTRNLRLPGEAQDGIYRKMHSKAGAAEGCDLFAYLINLPKLSSSRCNAP